MVDLTRGFCPSPLETSVGAVLASDELSIELSVEVMLCFEGERRMVLVGRDGLGFGLSDFTEL